jgi:hypothetical protein
MLDSTPYRQVTPAPAQRPATQQQAAVAEHHSWVGAQISTAQEYELASTARIQQGMICQSIAERQSKDITRFAMAQQ